MPNGSPDRSRAHQALKPIPREIAAHGDVFTLSRRVTARILHPVAGFKAKPGVDYTALWFNASAKPATEFGRLHSAIFANGT